MIFKKLIYLFTYLLNLISERENFKIIDKYFKNIFIRNLYFIIQFIS
jgi:hypothetical protein